MNGGVRHSSVRGCPGAGPCPGDRQLPCSHSSRCILKLELVGSCDVASRPELRQICGNYNHAVFQLSGDHRHSVDHDGRLGLEPYLLEHM